MYPPTFGEIGYYLMTTWSSQSSENHLWLYILKSAHVNCLLYFRNLSCKFVVTEIYHASLCSHGFGWDHYSFNLILCDDVEVLTMTFCVLLFKKYPLYFNSRSLSLISMEDCNMSLIQISKSKIWIVTMVIGVNWITTQKVITTCKDGSCLTFCDYGL